MQMCRPGWCPEEASRRGAATDAMGDRVRGPGRCHLGARLSDRQWAKVGAARVVGVGGGLRVQGLQCGWLHTRHGFWGRCVVHVVRRTEPNTLCHRVCTQASAARRMTLASAPVHRALPRLPLPRSPGHHRVPVGPAALAQAPRHGPGPRRRRSRKRAAALGVRGVVTAAGSAGSGRS